VSRGPLLHQRPAKALDIWLAIYCACIIGYKLRAWSVRPAPLAFYVAALLLLSLPCLTSIIGIYVLRALHRVRVHLPVRRLQHPGALLPAVRWLSSLAVAHAFMYVCIHA
jgi:hypothetical protein